MLACGQPPEAAPAETSKLAIVHDAASSTAAPADLRRDHAQGVDVSHHQETIDWPEVLLSGIHFAYVKATEGVDYQDPRFVENWQGAQRAGLLRGAYHMLRPEDDALAQAQWFVEVLRAAGYEARDLPPALDVERVSTTTQIPRHQTADRALVWLRFVEQELGRRPLLYTNPIFWRDYLVADHPLTDYPLWLADYSEEPAADSPWGEKAWLFWQFTERADLPGITRPVDLNRFSGAPERLRESVLGGGTPPP
jgi:lysozyme